MSDELKRLRFNRKPSPVLPDHRPLYKIGQVLMILYLASRSGRSRLSRLHLFNWALKNSQRRAHLLLASKTGVLNVTAWGFDPALAIAIRYAIAEGLLLENSNGYNLSDAGEIFAKELLKHRDVFSQEKEFLVEVGKNITEGMVDKIASRWEME